MSHETTDATEERLLEQWRREAAGTALGWDFSELEGRMDEDEPPWDFDDLSRRALAEATSVLDMGTGGGEQLLRFTDVLPTDTTATEGWAPNVPVARASLEPRGIEVVDYDPESTDPVARRMPCVDDRFGLVLNRHEAFVADEIARVLRPGGTFLTQQVSSDDAHELHAMFGGTATYPAHLMRLLSGQLITAGLEVTEQRDWSGSYRFRDVAALVAYLRLVPWDAPEDFSVDRYAERLLRLHHDAAGRDITITKRRFWLLARKARPMISRR